MALLPFSWCRVAGLKQQYCLATAATRRGFNDHHVSFSHDTPLQLKGLMTYSERRPGLMIDSDRRFDVDESMMKSAAIGGDKETWSAVLAQLERLMSKVEVRRSI